MRAKRRRKRKEPGTEVFARAEREKFNFKKRLARLGVGRKPREAMAFAEPEIVRMLREMRAGQKVELPTRAPCQWCLLEGKGASQAAKGEAVYRGILLCLPHQKRALQEEAAKPKPKAAPAPAREDPPAQRAEVYKIGRKFRPQ